MLKPAGSTGPGVLGVGVRATDGVVEWHRSAVVAANSSLSPSWTSTSTNASSLVELVSPTVGQATGSTSQHEQRDDSAHRMGYRSACWARIPSWVVTRGRAAGDAATSTGLNVNSQLARHRIEALDHYPKITRARALAAYVGAFDLADEHGVVEASSEQIASEFGIGRTSWLHYRALLEEAGLLVVDARRGPVRRGFRLLPPQ